MATFTSRPSFSSRDHQPRLSASELSSPKATTSAGHLLTEPANSAQREPCSTARVSALRLIHNAEPSITQEPVPVATVDTI
jgi:hypothetical protein